MNELPRAERNVARALLSRSPTAGLESSIRLAESVGTSGPTVIRFVNRLGYPTYAAFKDAWRAEIDARLESPVAVYERHQPETNAGNLIAHNEKVLSGAVSETLRTLTAGELEQAVALCSATRRRLLVFGGWFSQVLARHLVALLQEARPGVMLLEQVPSARARALIDTGKRDVAVVFDFRRYESETLTTAQVLAERGADVVLFTDQWLSPVAELATAVLVARAAPPAPFDSLVPQMAVLETFASAVVDQLGPAVGTRLKALSGIPGALTPSWTAPGR